MVEVVVRSSTFFIAYYLAYSSFLGHMMSQAGWNIHDWITEAENAEVTIDQKDISEDANSDNGVKVSSSLAIRASTDKLDSSTNGFASLLTIHRCIERVLVRNDLLKQKAKMLPIGAILSLIVGWILTDTNSVKAYEVSLGDVLTDLTSFAGVLGLFFYASIHRPHHEAYQEFLDELNTLRTSQES